MNNSRDDAGISIHALPRRATSIRRSVRLTCKISIHALPRRATTTPPCANRAETFQSTPSRGGRLLTAEGGQVLNGDFNPRPPAEGDWKTEDGTDQSEYFNPRPPAEGDYLAAFPFFIFLLFQSTPSRGGRPAVQYRIAPLIAISIHALPRRATSSSAISAERFSNFNPRPPAEGDRPPSGLWRR